MIGKKTKIAILVVFVVLAFYLFRFTSIASYLTSESIDSFLSGFGVLAPVVFVLIYAIGICLFVPGTILTGLGSVLFGVGWGFLVNFLGAMIGASGAFFIGRYLGRDYASELVGKRLKKYDEAIEKHGFATILYLRLLFFPFVPLNFGAGLTKVKFSDYFWGTFIGIIPGSFIFTFAIGTIALAFTTRDFSLLLGWQTFLALSLFVFSFFIPSIIKRTRFSKWVGV